VTRAGPRLLVLLGDPVDHSLSPIIQNAAIRTAGLDGCYVPLRCSADDVGTLMRVIAAGGGGGNITVPHKQAAMRHIEHATPAVLRSGACNTFWLERGRLAGDNTDLAGFSAALTALIGAPTGIRALLIGAGGAARAAACALLDGGAAAVAILARDEKRAGRLREDLDAGGSRVRPVTADAAARESFDLIVNATPLGLAPSDPQPCRRDLLARAGAVLDFVYRPGETPWVREARALGLRAADGREMLLHQAAAAFTRWWDSPAPLHVMRAALAAELSGRGAAG
jgi:shikimate dehydrogenase